MVMLLTLAGILDWRELPPENFIRFVIPTSSNHTAIPRELDLPKSLWIGTEAD